MLTLTLRKPLAHGADRKLTPKECIEIKDQRTNVRPYCGPNWKLVRNDDGSLSLLQCLAGGGNTSWAIEEIVQNDGVLSIRLSTPIGIGERRSPTIQEMQEINENGVDLFPGCEIARISSKFLLLTCGKERWFLQEVLQRKPQNRIPAKSSMFSFPPSILQTLGLVF